MKDEFYCFKYIWKFCISEMYYFDYSNITFLCLQVLVCDVSITESDVS